MATSGTIFIIYCTPEAAVWFSDDVGKRREVHVHYSQKPFHKLRDKLQRLNQDNTNGQKRIVFMHRDYIHTCDLTAIELEAQSDPVLPSLGSDSDESSQDGLRDPVQDHFRGVRVGMESLQRRNREEQISNEGFFFLNAPVAMQRQ